MTGEDDLQQAVAPPRTPPCIERDESPRPGASEARERPHAHPHAHPQCGTAECGTGQQCESDNPVQEKAQDGSDSE